MSTLRTYIQSNMEIKQKQDYLFIITESKLPKFEFWRTFSLASEASFFTNISYDQISFRHQFSKLEYCEPFEALAQKFENTIHISKIPLHD